MGSISYFVNLTSDAQPQPMSKLFDPSFTIILLILAFLAILFLQSGLDKVFNYKGNLEWLKGHFAKSPLKGSVGLMMPVITILEVAAGLLCAIGLVTYIWMGDTYHGYIGCLLSAVSIVALFFGQRLAQEYEGAQSLTTYFLITLLGIYMLGLS